MLSDDDIARDATQLAAYRGSDALSEILDKYSTLIQEYRRLKSDYEEERDAREKYKQVAKSQERNPFVLVLIDGDGYVFNEDLVGKGADAGSTAAQKLHEAIQASLRTKGLEHCQVMVRIYANVAGLSKAMNKAGGQVGAEKRSLAPFIASFNRSYGLTELVDAGEFKENADFKLRALLRLYAENAQCKHIYFAACHDVGYVSELTPHTGNSARFTLIDAHCIRFQKEFTKLGMGIEKLPGVFRNTPLEPSLPFRPPNSTGAAAVQPLPPPPAVQPPATSQRQKVVCQNFSSGNCKFGSGCRYLHAEVERRNTSSSWRESQPDITTILREIRDLPSKDNLPEGHVAVNRKGFRLDPYIRPATNNAINKVNARTRKLRICNNFHLNGYCPSGDHCPYDHDLLEDEFKAALEALARSTPCGKRGACRDGACTKGHICQVADCKHRGGKGYCKLPYGSHTEDLMVAQYVPVTKPAQDLHVPSINDSTGSSSIYEEEVHLPSGLMQAVDEDDTGGW